MVEVANLTLSQILKQPLIGMRDSLIELEVDGHVVKYGGCGWS
jgi:hypothetical protein